MQGPRSDPIRRPRATLVVLPSAFHIPKTGGDGPPLEYRRRPEHKPAIETSPRRWIAIAPRLNSRCAFVKQASRVTSTLRMSHSAASLRSRAPRPNQRLEKQRKFREYPTASRNAVTICRTRIRKHSQRLADQCGEALALTAAICLTRRPPPCPHPIARGRSAPRPDRRRRDARAHPAAGSGRGAYGAG